MTNYQKYKLLIIIVFSTILLMILNNYSSNGRYVFSNVDHISILDTRTGTQYRMYGGKRVYVEIEMYSKLIKNKSKK